jgi:protease I
MRIACALGPEFEDSEFRVPYDRFRRAGHQVTVIGLEEGEQLAGKHGRERVTVERGVDEASPDEFDALYIPGGRSPDHLRADERMVRFVRGFGSKPILAICHGPQLLISAEMVRGRTMTAWRTVQVDLRNAGANAVDREVVVDANLITSRQPQDLDAFVSESLRHLGAASEEAHP